MLNKTYLNKIDMKYGMRNNRVLYTTGDTKSATMIFGLYDGADPYELTDEAVYLNLEFADGSDDMVIGTVTANIVEFTIPGFPCAGETQFDITVAQGKKTVTTPRSKFVVSESIILKGVENEEKYHILSDLIEEVRDIIGTDLSPLLAKIAQLKSDLELADTVIEGKVLVNSRLIETKTDKTDFQATTKDLGDRISSNDVDISVLEGVIDNLQMQIDKIIGNDVTGGTIDLTEVTGARKSSLDGQDKINLNGRITFDVGTLKNLIEGVRTDLTATNQSLATTNHNLDAVQSQADVSTSDLSKLKPEMSGVRGEITLLRDKVASVKADVDDVSLDLALVSSDVADATSDLASVKGDIATVQTDVATSKTDIANLKSKDTWTTVNADTGKFATDVVIGTDSVAQVISTLKQFEPDIENAVQHVTDTARQDQFGHQGHGIFATNCRALDAGHPNTAKWIDHYGFISWYVNTNFEAIDRHSAIQLTVPKTVTKVHDIFHTAFQVDLKVDGTATRRTVNVDGGVVTVDAPPGGWGDQNAIRFVYFYEAY